MIKTSSNNKLNMKNSTKIKQAKELIDSMIYNHNIKDYELISEYIDREYPTDMSKPSIIGAMLSISDVDDTSDFSSITVQDLKIRLRKLHLILEKFSEYLYLPDEIWKWQEKQKEEEQEDIFNQIASQITDEN